MPERYQIADERCREEEGKSPCDGTNCQGLNMKERLRRGNDSYIGGNSFYSVD